MTVERTSMRPLLFIILAFLCAMNLVLQMYTFFFTRQRGGEVQAP